MTNVKHEVKHEKQVPVLRFVCEEKSYLWQVKPSHNSECYFVWRGNKFSQLATLNLAKLILFLYGYKILQFKEDYLHICSNWDF